jgi:hypothetical protein
MNIFLGLGKRLIIWFVLVAPAVCLMYLGSLMEVHQFYYMFVASIVGGINVIAFMVISERNAEINVLKNKLRGKNERINNKNKFYR